MAVERPDVVTLEVPDDARYLRVAIVAVEALAARARVDKDDLVALRGDLEAALAARFAGLPGERVLLRYEVGDGFLGVRVLGAAGQGTTS